MIKTGPVALFALSTSLLVSGCGKGLSGLAAKIIGSELAIVSPSDTSYINDANKLIFPISGTCKTIGADVTWTATDASAATVTGTVACAGNVWTVSSDLSSFADGAVTITASQVETVGAAAQTVSVILNKDIVSPTLTIATPAIDGLPVPALDVSAFTIAGTCDGDLDLTVKDLSGAAYAQSTPVTCRSGVLSGALDLSSKADGNYSLVFAQTDAAGNTGTVTRSVLKDVTAPTLTILTPSSAATVDSLNGSAFAVAGACETDGSQVAYSIGSVSGNFPCTTGAWTGSINLTSLNSGNYTFTVTQTDAALNTGTATVGVTKPLTIALAVSAQVAKVIGTEVKVSMSATFTANVTGFDSSDISAGTGVVSNFVASTGSIHTFDVTWPTSRTGTVTIGQDAATNNSNGNIAKSLDVISFVDDLQALFDMPLANADNSASNNVACIFCHSPRVPLTADPIVSASLCNASSSSDCHGRGDTTKYQPPANSLAAGLAIETYDNTPWSTLTSSFPRGDFIESAASASWAAENTSNPGKSFSTSKLTLANTFIKNDPSYAFNCYKIKPLLQMSSSGVKLTDYPNVTTANMQNSKLYAKIKSTGNMPRNTADPASPGAPILATDANKNAYRFSDAQLAKLTDWYNQGGFCY
jgi:hypothetical protein